MIEKSTIARNIESLAKQQGLSLRELARRSGLSNPTISAIVNRGAMPRAKNAAAIAAALGVTVDDLYNPSLIIRTFLDATAKAKASEGNYVVAFAEGIERPVVRIFIKSDTGKDWLIADNPHYPGEKNLRLEKILGVVVAKSAKLV